MIEESKEIIVLGAIKHGIKKFDKIQKITQIDPEELHSILEYLEKKNSSKSKKRKDGLEKRSKS